MFGTFRLLLALMVLLKHFHATEVFSGLAVWAFFLLSGFLITGILNTRYGYSREGLVEFFFNRALRLLPTYWASVALALLLILLFGSQIDPRLVNSAFAFPDSVWEWVPAVAIVGGTALGLGRVENSPSPSAWAVEVEILLYVISAWGMSRTWANSRRCVILCVALFPVLWLASKWILRNGHAELAGSITYSFLPAALLPYASGALLWHCRDRFKLTRNPTSHLVLTALVLAVCGLWLSRISVTAVFVVSVPLFGYATLLLSKVSAQAPARSVDTFLGHMSYPVYLMHWVATYVVVGLADSLGAGPNLTVINEMGLLQTTGFGFVAVTAVTLVLAMLVAALLEVPIERHRRRLAQGWRQRIFAGPHVRELQ